MKQMKRPIPTSTSSPMPTWGSANWHASQSAKQEHPLVFMVEHEQTIPSMLSRALEQAGFIVRTFHEEISLLPAALQQTPALIVLDVALRSAEDVALLDAVNAQESLRGTGRIVLSACADEKVKVRALESGADDYITKPFSTREVVARVRAVLRSRQMPSPSNRILRVGNLSADLDARRAWAAERELSLTATEFNLLVHFLRYPDQVVGRKTLQSKLWQKQDGQRVVDVYIYRLRQKIEVDPAAPLQLITCRKDGYMLLGSHEHSTAAQAPQSE
jgi:DNA-binding response OmpR family regulator